MYKSSILFGWWWFIVIPLCFLCLSATVIGLQNITTAPGAVITAFVFDVLTAGLLLMPWNYVLTTVVVDTKSVRVVKWPGVFKAEILAEDIKAITLQKGHVYRSVWQNATFVDRELVTLSRVPVAVDAWSDTEALVVTSKSNKPALFLPTKKQAGVIQHAIETCQTTKTTPSA